MICSITPRSGFGERAIAWLGGLLLCIGCTPIRPVAELTVRPDAGGAAGTAALGGAVSDAAQPSAAVVAKGGDACPSESARSCSGHATRTPLLCKSSVWQPEPPCGDDERCDTAAGANQGRCRPIAMECTGHEHSGRAKAQVRIQSRPALLTRVHGSRFLCRCRRQGYGAPWRAFAAGPPACTSSTVVESRARGTIGSPGSGSTARAPRVPHRR